MKIKKKIYKETWYSKTIRKEEAYVGVIKMTKWFKDESFHKDNGPAYINSHRNKIWFYYGTGVSEEVYWNL